MFVLEWIAHIIEKIVSKAVCMFLQIYEGKSNSTGHVLHVSGAETRPFFVSSGNDMTVEFRTGTNINRGYLGFRASYYLVSSKLCTPVCVFRELVPPPLHSTPLTGRAIKPQRQGHIGGPIAQP